MPNLTSVEKEFSNLTKKRGFLSSLIDKDIADSWKRCISTGLDPLKKPKRTILSSKELNELKEKNEYIRRLINPELELLYSQIAGTNFMVAYSDSTGSVMDTIYDKTCLKTDVGKIVIPGSIWREEIGGTNGLGQVVTLNKDSIVSGKEHFFESHGKLSCFASPILNHEGKTIGIIDASTDVHSREQHTIALVKLATKSIETKLFINQFKDELILSFHPRQEYLSTNSVGLLAINGDGFVVGSNSNARIMLHGLAPLKNENFNNIFTTSFSSIANELLQNKILKISDHLGSSVFIIKSQNFKKKISKETGIKTYACNNCKGSKFKEERCVLIKSAFIETGNISAASRKLGVSRTTIYKHLK
jgi:transcriptional regulator of acetoin/glycerol metabolism